MHNVTKFWFRIRKVPQLGFHIITVLQSSSAQIGNSRSLVVICCSSSRKLEAVKQTTYVMNYRVAVCANEINDRIAAAIMRSESTN